MDFHSNAAVSGGLAEDFLPCDNMEGGDGVSLEWLSVFVEDCINGGFTTPTTTTTTAPTTSHQTPNPSQGQAQAQQQQGGPSRIIQKTPSSVSVSSAPSKTRTSKRRRTNLQTNNNSNNSLHTFHLMNYSDPPPLLPQAYWLADSELLIRPKMEARTEGSPEEEEEDEKEVVVMESINSSEEGQLGPRRCTHCLSYKTPQWRAGPLGPKTLCNACGVRFKSGRLLPEYRPAKSPTFESFKHSNSHKKIMEMRMMATVLSSDTN